MVLANQYLEESIHPDCGQPAFESFDPNGPEYRIEEPICRACARRQEAADRGSGDIELAKGLQVQVIPMRGVTATPLSEADMAHLLGG